ncbi:MAG: hypothetical protein D6767_08060 [Candidatus Hydrogenedentota bacterium]|nr:MAG: hypothetical protein D6767_08060 [Candidatus Hydrogenedentota bacterium]
MTSEFKWFKIGDFNAFFTLFLDNVLNLVILASILVQGFGFPEKIVYMFMIPGTAVGVMFGDLVYSYMGYKLAKKENRADVTAMPLGLDTPSTIGMAVFVLGPAFLYFKSQLSGQFSGDDLTYQAGLHAWFTGMAIMIWMGLVKIITSYLGNTIQRYVPSAGLLGSIAGIGLVYLAADQFITTMEFPLAGLTALALVLFTLVAHQKLPANLPGAAVAVLAGLIVYYGSGILGIFGQEFKGLETLPVQLAIPYPHFSWPAYFFKEAILYLPIAIPFGLLTIVGGINVTESARLSGDNFNTKNILLTEAFATIVAGLFGGVSQSTPYIGHGAYKRMGAGVGYTLATGILIGIGAALGLVGYIVYLIPHTVVAPILIFIGFEITAMAYLMTPKEHNMAVSIAIIPTIIHFGYTKLKMLYEPFHRFLKEAADAASALKASGLDHAAVKKAIAILSSAALLYPARSEETYPYLQALSQGFIITGMIWGAATVFIIQQKYKNVLYTLLFGAVLSFFGMIHSATSSGEIYLPWVLNDPNYIPYKFASAYALTGILLYGLGTVASKDSR